MASCSGSAAAATVALRGDKIAGRGCEKERQRSSTCFPLLSIGGGFGSKPYPSLRMELPRRGLEAMMSDQAVVSRGMTGFALDHFRSLDYKEEGKRNVGTMTPEKLDTWLRDSIHEIVRNIGEAPLLVQMFSGGDGCMRMEAVTPECWPCIKGRWGRESGAPDGIVLVEELKGEEEGGEVGEDRRRMWGLVVQGRGCAAACYVLDVCRVRSSVGFCTHFCLMRAQCFGETAEEQLRKAWLQEKR